MDKSGLVYDDDSALSDMIGSNGLAIDDGGGLYAGRMEPIAVRASEGEKTNPGVFKDIEKSLSWEMEFPGALYRTVKQVIHPG